LRRRVVGVIALAVGLLRPVPVPAQQAAPSHRWGVGAGAGITIPTGAYAASDDPGFHGLMYFSYSVRPAFALGLDVGATRTPHTTNGHTDLTEVLIGVVWRARPQATSPRPFLLGSVGVIAVDTDNPDKGRLALGGGAGVSVGHGDARFFMEARFLHVHGSGGWLSLVPITAGFATVAP